MSKQQAKLLRFLIKYRKWQSIGPDARRTACTLVAHGLIEFNEHYQVRLVRGVP